MLFNYSAITKEGEKREGSVDAVNEEAAISALQKRGLFVSSISSSQDSWWSQVSDISFFNSVSNRDIVLLSRQMSTLFESQISALRVFRLLSEESDNELVGKTLTEVADDIQGGAAISEALSKHPSVFSSFYVNMVKAGEESGRLDETFKYLADYLERTYAITSKAKNALVYPAFVIVIFFAVMGLMFTFVIPQIAEIIVESGEELPIYTEIILSISDFLVSYGLFILFGIVLALAAGAYWRQTPEGRYALDTAKLSVPFIGDLYRKLYLSRIADNMNTMISSGVPMVHALEISAEVVGNEVYKTLLQDAVQSVKGGTSVSEAFGVHDEIPSIMVQMVRVGEESGSLGSILDTLAKFYQREVSTAVDTLVSLIEPALIIALGLGVGILLASVLMPIYNITTGAAI